MTDADLRAELARLREQYEPTPRCEDIGKGYFVEDYACCTDSGVELLVGVTTDDLGGISIESVLCHGTDILSLLRPEVVAGLEQQCENQAAARCRKDEREHAEHAAIQEEMHP